ncbi:MAG: zinc ribbon domain-containing protein, partial [Methanobrevibacter sp.]|nr:zinc ribbon domain-containing protein [Methanobrevibacter sp.]
QGTASQEAQSVNDSSDQDNSEKSTTESSSSKKNTEVVDKKSWESIGSYSGSGSGSKTISVPEGKIMVKLSAYPIKNYATNHLYVSGSNGESGGVDWGSKSAVETRSDSFTYTSSSEETFTIDYYETVSWEVEFYRYQ